MLFKNKRNKKSLTLIELIMVMVIVGILVRISSMFIKQTIDLWLYVNVRNEVVSQCRLSLMRITREMKQNKDNLSVYAASATQYRFIDINNNTIEYRFSGNTLIRKLNSNPDDILASGLDTSGGASKFVYFGVDNLELAVPLVNPNETDISYIKITVKIVSGKQFKVLTSQVWLRND